MVGTLARLQLTLFSRAVRGSVSKIIGLVIGVVYLLGALIGCWIGFWLLRVNGDAALTASIGTTGFGLLTVMWPIMIMLVFGSDQTLDPGRFALLPVRARELMPGLLAASFLGLGGIALVLLGLGLVVAWSGSPVTAVFALVGAVIGVLTCQLAGRALVAALAGLFTRRRFRDLTAALLGFGVLALMVVVNLVIGKVQGSSLASVDQILGQAAGVLSWTPFGWAWALPADAAAGDWAVLALRSGLAAAVVVVLWLLWQRSLDKALTSPLTASGEGVAIRSGSLLASVLPQSPAGAIAYRSLVYWRRDSRHSIQLVSTLMIPILMAVPGLTSNEPGMGEIAVVGAPLMMGALALMVVMMELSYDGSALWAHVAAGIPGRADRWGRALAALILLVPLQLVVSVLLAAVFGRWDLLATSLGGGLTLLGVSTGVGSVVGALWQQALPPPGSNPFSKGTAGGLDVLVGSLIAMAVTGVLAIPVIVLAFLPHRVWAQLTLLGLAVTFGPLVVWVGVRWGGQLLDRRWPEVLARITYERA